MFIPDPTFSIPDPGSDFFHPGSQIRMLTFYPSQIPNSGVKKAADPGSGSSALLGTLSSPNQIENFIPVPDKLFENVYAI
jgi:hypothetical protein